MTEKINHLMSEKINHPPHYGGDSPYETIKVIEAWRLDFHLGNAVKYISRAKLKGAELEDLKKARWYLDRKIDQLDPPALITSRGAVMHKRCGYC